ncbi:hypothetical protein GCM10027159_09510 [Lysobacter terrae]
MKRILFAALAAATVCAGTAQAAPSAPLKECVSLSGSQQATRFGSQFVLIHDGDTYYRLHADRCDKLSLATRVTVRADSQPDRICPSDTRIETNTGNCIASKVETIDETTYRRYQHRR